MRVALTSLAVLLVVGLPLGVVLLTSVKPLDEATVVNLSLPSRFAFFENVAAIFEQADVVRAFGNSMLITVPTIIVTLFLAALAAWVFARTRSRLPRILYYLMIAGIMLPPAVISTIRVLDTAGLNSSYLGISLFYIGTQMGAAIFLITGFVKGIPEEIEEAARMDGASALRVFVSIILPMLRPILLVAGVSLTLLVWNDFFYAFFILGDPALRTMPLELYGFASANAYQYNWGLIFTYVVMTSLPLLILFLVAQRHIVSGLLGGAGK